MSGKSLEMSTENSISTEEKILMAASKVFTQKGYAGTKTRDIAEEAGINLALLNYYFRSKEKLFQKVMLLKFRELFSEILPILTDEKTSLDDKIDKASDVYFKILSNNPTLPLFVISEIQKNSAGIHDGFPMEKVLKDSAIIRQISVQKPGSNPFHYLFNFLGMTVFPFVAKPLFMSFELMDEPAFRKFVEERRKLVPQWMKILLNSPTPTS